MHAAIEWMFTKKGQLTQRRSSAPPCDAQGGWERGHERHVPALSALAQPHQELAVGAVAVKGRVRCPAARGESGAERVRQEVLGREPRHARIVARPADGHALVVHPVGPRPRVFPPLPHRIVHLVAVRLDDVGCHVPDAGAHVPHDLGQRAMERLPGDDAAGEEDAPFARLCNARRVRGESRCPPGTGRHPEEWVHHPGQLVVRPPSRPINKKRRFGRQATSPVAGNPPCAVRRRLAGPPGR